MIKDEILEFLAFSSRESIYIQSHANFTHLFPQFPRSWKGSNLLTVSPEFSRSFCTRYISRDRIVDGSKSGRHVTRPVAFQWMNFCLSGLPVTHLCRTCIYIRIYIYIHNPWLGFSSRTLIRYMNPAVKGFGYEFSRGLYYLVETAAVES